jgi:hypothetical protein
MKKQPLIYNRHWLRLKLSIGPIDATTCHEASAFALDDREWLSYLPKKLEGA